MISGMAYAFLPSTAQPCVFQRGHQPLPKHFGGMDCRQGTAPPLARMSFLYEVRSRFIVAAEISPYEEGELTQARELLGGRVWEQDCVLYDRGYNDPRIIAWSLAQDSHFCDSSGGGEKALQRRPLSVAKLLRSTSTIISVTT